jgi:hypothetical protein
MSEEFVIFRFYPEIKVMSGDMGTKVEGIAFKEFRIHREVYEAIVKQTEIDTYKRIETRIANQFSEYTWSRMIVDYISYLRSEIGRKEKQ